MSPPLDLFANQFYCPYATADDLRDDIGESIREGGSFGGVFCLKSTRDRVVQKIVDNGTSCSTIVKDMELLLNADSQFLIKCHQILVDSSTCCVYAILDYYPKYLLDVLNNRKAYGTAADINTFLAIAYDITQGLAYFHTHYYTDSGSDENKATTRTYFHGNLNSSTIMFNEDETHCVLTYPKFHVRTLKDNRTASSNMRYAAPEVRGGAEYSSAADMWSLGVVLYELVGGSLKLLPTSTLPFAESHSEAFLDALPVSDTFIRKVLSYLLKPNPYERITIMPLLHILELYRDNLKKINEIKELRETARQIEQDNLIFMMKGRRESCDKSTSAHSTLHQTDSNDRARTEYDSSAFNSHHPSVKGHLEEDDGVTALMRFADSGNLWFTRLYLPMQVGKVTTAGENIKGWGLKGRTALMGAALYNRLEVVEVLAPYEAGMQQNCDNATALMMAAFMGYEEIVNVLVDREKCMVDDSGYTALIYAVLQKHLSIVSILAPYEAGAQSKDGSTALMMAASINYIDAANILASREAGLRSDKGCTARMIARQNGFNDLEKLLATYEGID
ncbi:NEK-GL-like kinase protein [Giardia lamblia P15]|uniref:NEK-GL-like kinase protein n=1 Tax=Giardia intestinalis (strain P15) TaxID=658858 RepID=E1F4E5_GIAIA|nr:NEK-GL-like kinase protein [Giardia lamblia P15]